MSELKKDNLGTEQEEIAVSESQCCCDVAVKPVAKKHVNSKKLKDGLFVLSFLIYPMILFAIFYIGVNFNSILISFKKYELIDGVYQESFVGFQNFIDFINNITGVSGTKAGEWSMGLINSLKMYAISLIICLPLYIVFSYILYKKCFAHKALRIIVMLPQIISGFIMCLVFKRFIEDFLPALMVNAFGATDFPPSLLQSAEYSFGTTLFYTIWVSFSTSLIVYPNAMNEIDDGIIEAAHLDGVGNIFQELWYILIPLIFPTISTFLITGFAAIFVNAGSIPTFYMYEVQRETVNIGYLYWREIALATKWDGYPMLSAGGLLMTIVVAPLTLLLKKFLEKFDPEVD